MAKYSINTLGEVIDANSGQKKEIQSYLSDLIRLPNRLNKVEDQTNKFSERNAGSLLFVTENLFNNTNGDKNKNELNRVVNSTNKLTNSSFGFDSDPKREVTFYNSYNSIFDLNLENFSNTSNVENVQIFAENLDFYGFPLLLTNIEELIGDELPTRLFSLLDMIIAATVPITLISTLQFLLQENENNGAATIPSLFGDTNQAKMNEDVVLYNFGSYIKYEKSEDFNLFYDIAKITLQSFERLMNYPRFTLPPKADNIFEKLLAYVNFLVERIIYFMNGYIFYLNPGLKTNFTLDSFDLTSLTDFIASLITTNSSRHQYNLLLRKILRNNYFLNIVTDGEAKKTENNSSNFNSQLSFLSSFFFRFVGERISIGENLIRTDTNKAINNSNFFKSRTDGLPSLSIGHIIESSDNKKIKSYNTLFSINKAEKDNSLLPRFSYEQVKNIEDLINLDYMPFSLQDMRTNEVLKFHAFIESISDTYNANYNEMGGYGRLEKIKTYANTTRSISVSFKIVAMSQSDHHQMWHMINKIVSMLYPQWSKGVAMRDSTMERIRSDVYPEDNLDENLKNLTKIAIPFSQLPSNSPMIRLRVGDLITSNYSKYTVAKLFGFEPKVFVNKDQKKEYPITSDDIIKSLNESIVEFIKSLKSKDNDTIEVKNKINEIRQNIDKEEYQKSLYRVVSKNNQDYIIQESSRSNDTNRSILTVERSSIYQQEKADKAGPSVSTFICNLAKKENFNNQFKIYFFVDTLRVKGKSNTTNSYEIVFKFKGGKIDFKKTGKFNSDYNDINVAYDNLINPIMLKKKQDLGDVNLVIDYTKNSADLKSNYVKLIGTEWHAAEFNIEKRSETTTTEDKIISMNDYDFVEKMNKILQFKSNSLRTNALRSQDEKRKEEKKEAASFASKTDLQQAFLQSTGSNGDSFKINNPIIKAFESNMGKGLAGFITSFNIDWEQGTFWEIKEGNRAPKIVTITLGLSPSHDIPLGLDHRGNLRSLAYSVGSGASINRGLYMQENNFNYDENQFKKREE